MPAGTVPGHGNSPAAWTAVIIMIIAFAIGTFAFWFALPWLVWASAGLLVVGALVGLVMKLVGFGVGGDRSNPNRTRKPPISTDMLAELVAGALEDASDRRSAVPLCPRRSRRHRAPARARRACCPRARGPGQDHRRGETRESLARCTGRYRGSGGPRGSYETGGASAISVLTERRRFGGSLEDLELVRATVSVPSCARTSSPTRTRCSRPSGRSRPRAAHCRRARTAENAGAVRPHRRAGDDRAGRTHSADEVERALDLGATIVGVNARNLSTFGLDRDCSVRSPTRFRPASSGSQNPP